MPRYPSRSHDFQKVYYAKVGLGEGCGCAERVIDMHEFDRRAGKAERVGSNRSRKGAWRRFLNKSGLTSRPKG